MNTQYFIKSYSKVKRSFLSQINTLDDSGRIYDDYDVVLEKRMFFGFIKKEVTKRISLPRGYNVSKNLTKGREFKT